MDVIVSALGVIPVIATLWTIPVWLGVKIYRQYQEVLMDKQQFLLEAPEMGFSIGKR